MEQSTEKLSNFIEDTDNPIIQVLQEFLTFLYLVEHDSKENEMLHNIFQIVMKLEMRTLLYFFSNERKDEDDYIYTDFIVNAEDLSVELPNNALRRFINKNTMHLSKKRGKLTVPTTDLTNTRDSLIKSINRFTEALATNLSGEFVAYSTDERVEKIKTCIRKNIIKIVLSNIEEGKKIDI